MSAHAWEAICPGVCSGQSAGWGGVGSTQSSMCSCVCGSVLSWNRGAALNGEAGPVWSRMSPLSTRWPRQAAANLPGGAALHSFLEKDIRVPRWGSRALGDVGLSASALWAFGAGGLFVGGLSWALEDVEPVVAPSS